MDLFELLGTITIKNGEANEAIDETTKKAGESQGKLSKFFSGVGKGAAVVGKAVGAGMVAAGTAVVGLVTKSTQAYAEYEQLVGGVDTLFKDSSAKVQAYAEKAYETAGMSANEYMTTVTSFSASLLQSLGGDTEKAADAANQAVIDMSDNANKMGTSMEMIQNAYQGFAKQNYTMLDNLKLGYGGTKEEMQRLLDDAEKLSGQKFDISSYADVVDAIHVVQEEMGITGTTASEAAGTISGSMASVKGAWTNLVTAMASDDLPLDEYITKFVDSASTMVSNMLPRIETALGGVVQLVNKLAPVIIGKIPELFTQLLPSVIEAATGLISAVVEILPDLIGALINMIPAFIDGVVQIINAIITALPQVVQALVSALPVLIPVLINGLVSIIVTLCTMIPQIIQPIIDNLPMIIISIVTALMENLPVLIEGLITLVLGLVEAIPQIIQALVDALPMVMESIIVGLFNLLPVLIQGFIDLVVGVASAVDSIWSSVKEAFVNYFKGVWNGMTQVFSQIGEWFGEKFGEAKEKATNAWSDFKDKMSEKWNDVKNVFSNVGGWFKNVFTTAWTNVKNVFSNVKGFFLEKWNDVKSAFSDLGAKISDSISESVKKGINGVIGGAENIINGFFGMINSAIDMINKIPNVNISKIKLVEFARLAKGGVVDEPTPAIFGEDGAEAVVPLENNTGWLDKIASRLHALLTQRGDGLDRDISTRSVELQQMQVSELKTLTAITNKILDAVLALDENMGGNLREALDGVSLGVNKREFARLVKESV